MVQAKDLMIGNYISTDDNIICTASRIETKGYTSWNVGDNFIKRADHFLKLNGEIGE